MKVKTPTTTQKKKRVQRHALLMQHKVTTIIAFTTAIFILCVENVKAFAAPLSSPDTIFMVATGVHSLAKRWKHSEGNSGFLNNVPSSLTFSKTQPAYASSAKAHTQRKSLTSLEMAFGFGVPAPSAPAPQMLDMKTSINAFGSWYNRMDPVARPPIYDE